VPRFEQYVYRVVDPSLNYGRRVVEDSLRTVHGIQPVRTVLDIGAGPGTDLLTARRVAPEAVLHGVEVYPPNQATLRDRGVVVHGLDLERDALPFADGQVDVVIANQILEHVKELFWVLHEVTRVLPVGGHAIIGVPNLASLHNRILLLLGQQPSAILSRSAHVRGYTYRDLVRTIELCFPGGFEVVERRGSNFYPLPSVLARPLARISPSMAWGMFLLLRKTRDYTDDGFLTFPVEEQLETNFWTGRSR
jgi:SAM-dependent methyltransferase